MECRLCKLTGRNVFNINSCCGQGQNTIKDAILDFVGERMRDKVHDRLNNDQVVCNICICMLDYLIEARATLLHTLLVEDEKLPNMGNLWTYFAMVENDHPFVGSSVLRSSRDNSPLYLLRKTKPTNPVLEGEIEKREKERSILQNMVRAKKANMGRNKHGRKRRELNAKVRSKSAEVKRMRRSLSKTAQSERCNSVASDSSIMSFRGSPWEESTTIARPRVKQTRSASQLWTCPDASCRKVHVNLEEYTAHMIEVHETKAYYFCNVCHIEYITRTEFNFHMKTHDSQILCGLCGTMLPTTEEYQKHVNLHLKSANFTCRICDFTFLTKKDCNKHIFSNHRNFSRTKKNPVKSQMNESIIKNVQVYEKQNTSVSYPTETVGPIMMDLTGKCAEKTFRPRTFEEVKYIMKTEKADIFNNRTMRSLGDDLVYNEDLELRPPTPPSPTGSSTGADSMYSSYYPKNRKMRKLNLEGMLRCDSRNSEVSGILRDEYRSGSEFRDDSSWYSRATTPNSVTGGKGRGQKYRRLSVRMNDVDYQDGSGTSDVDSEYQYIDNNKMINSLTEYENNLEKS